MDVKYFDVKIAYTNEVELVVTAKDEEHARDIVSKETNLSTLPNSQIVSIKEVSSEEVNALVNSNKQEKVTLN